MPRSATVSPLTYRRDAALSGACLALARYGGHEFEHHVHDELVIAVTEAGGAECRSRLGRERSGPGTIWISRPGDFHGGTVEPGTRWHYRSIYLDEAARSAICESFGQAGLMMRQGLYHDPGLAVRLLAAHARAEAGQDVAERQTAWLEAIAMMMVRYGEWRALPQAGREAGKIARVREFIAGNFERDISIGELAGMVGLSRFHLIRSFRREFGLPPHAYLNQCRLIAAKQMLASGHRLAEAAIAAGFYDQSQLCRLFKRTYGITPGTYAALSR
ncbi:MAG: AraC family transcriptional regulator [Alphaproteobacteria bacterium]|jgi:AraC-like DNA-binding protein|nr:AraC family transcriptional regulator [Alphaproteobacteria bacterium]